MKFLKGVLLIFCKTLHTVMNIEVENKVCVVFKHVSC